MISAPARDAQARAAAEAVTRQSYGKLVALLAARMRDVAEAEDALSDAFAAALNDWPINGIPVKPEAWLITVARRKFVDAARKRRSGHAASDHLKLIAEELEATSTRDMAIPDERLALMFACAHPAIDQSVRAPLILQTVLGFDAATIAGAFLIPPATMGQRLVRAKAKIKQAGIPFRVPDSNELAERLETVLEAIYAAYAEGWSDPTGTETRRRDLASEAIWLGRLVVSLLPEAPEAIALLALMLYAEARRSARRDAQGEFVPLTKQDPAHWDAAMIDEAEALLTRANGIGDTGRYQLEAAVQSAHIVRRRSGRTDWLAIEALYSALLAISYSPVVAINRAIAIAEARGATLGLAALDEIADDDRLAQYQPYWAARADLLARIGEIGDAEAAYQQAIGLESDPAVRRFLQGRCAALRAA
jgi:RNA polymerase sigma-70 factor (ECF subfamily)